MSQEKRLKGILKNLPNKPGVYIFKDENNNVIYVGKAKSLKKRVSSYFAKRKSFASPRLKKLVEQVKDICTIQTNTEAEALIIEAQLVKRYQPFFNVELKMGEKYPYVCVTVKEAYPRIIITRKKDRKDAISFGPFTKVRDLRNLLHLIENFFPIRNCSLKLSYDKPKNKRPCIKYFVGKCLGPCAGMMSKEKYQEVVEKILLLLGNQTEDLISKLKKEMEEAAKTLNFERAAKLRDTITAISRVQKQRISFPLEQNIPDETWEAINTLKENLNLKELPWRIEGIDISNINGKYAVGSVVVFQQGLANRNLYRRFRIKSTEGINDYKMIYEVVKRRYKRLLEEDLPLPDLILIDGGPGQLGYALKALIELGLQEQAVISLAKKEELIFMPYRTDPIALPKDSPALKLLQKVRDEAHRFAISYHRRLRSKQTLTSQLQKIKGLGKQKIVMLLSHFGSIRNLELATEEELTQLPGIGKKLAKKIKAFFQKQQVGKL